MTRARPPVEDRFFGPGDTIADPWMPWLFCFAGILWTAWSMTYLNGLPGWQGVLAPGTSN